MTGSFADKHFLILAGNPREVVDPFRYYVNYRRPDGYGMQVAAQLVELGAKVTVIMPTHQHVEPVPGITFINTKPDGSKIANAADLLKAASSLSPGSFTNILQLACPASFKCPNPSAEKLQKRKDSDRKNLFEVEGNLNIINHLLEIFPDLPVEGFDNKHNWYGEESFKKMADNTIHAIQAHIPTLRYPSRLGSLAGKTVVVTAGRTTEMLSTDGTMITNFFEGRQGFAIAEACAAKGAEVIVVHSPTYLKLPEHQNITCRTVNSAREMHEICTAYNPDIYAGAGAVADFGVETPYEINLREGEKAELNLVVNPNIVRSMKEQSKVLVMFAAQSPARIIKYATDKFEEVKPDFLVANPIGSNTIAATNPDFTQANIIDANGVQYLPEMLKRELGDIIADRAAACLKAKTKAVEIAVQRGGDGLGR